MRISMNLSFDDEESFKEAVGSLRFNNPPSDPNTLQQMGSMVPQDSERDEDICFIIIPQVICQWIYFGEWEVLAVALLLNNLNFQVDR